MLYVYLFVCGSMIIFNIVSAALFRLDEKKTERVSRNLQKYVMSQLKAAEANIPIGISHRTYLCRKLKRVGNMRAFDRMLEAEYIGHPKEIISYLRSLDDVLVFLMAYYSGRNRIEAAYYPYIIKKYRLIAYRRFPSIEGALLDMCNEQSIYCRENALQALYTTGNVDCIMKAVEIIDRSDLFFHGKLLCDGLLNFAGSKNKLADSLVKAFPGYSDGMKVTVLDYLRLSNDAFGEFALSVLQNESEGDEVRYASIRYLGKCSFEKAYEPLLRLARDGSELNWEYAAIASTALALYPGERTVQILKENLYSRNWYIRHNSALSLNRLKITYSQLFDVIDGNDRYAAEIIRYCLQRDRADGKARNNAGRDMGRDTEDGAVKGAEPAAHDEIDGEKKEEEAVLA